MRRRPVTLDEIRMGRLAPTTIPADSVAPNEDGDLVGIISVWRPLIRSLNRKRKAWNATAKPGLGLKPIKLHMLSIPYVRYDCRAKNCRHCGTLFYSHGHVNQVGVCCSDRCLKAVRAKMSKASAEKRSEARAATRADLICQTCKEPLEAKRSTAKFCSVRCRVAAHRVDQTALKG